MSDYVKLGDMVWFGMTISSPPSGQLINADETPRFYMYRNSNDVAVLQGNFAQRANLIGTYLGSGIISTGNGFSTGDFVEIQASGKLSGVQNRAVIKDFIVDNIYKANIVQVSGVNIPLTDFYTPTAMIENAVWNANINSHLTNETFGSGIDKTRRDIYFANIKFTKDSVIPDDEYNIGWFRNSQVLQSGQVTNSNISVFRTSDGTALFQNKKADYFSNLHGTLRYNESATLAVSGEAYLAVASGTIDGGTRTWSNLIGLDYL